jgi:hypothetical protein
VTRDAADSRPYDSSRAPSEGLISEFVKRFIETGAKSLSSDTVRQLLQEMKLPRDALLQLLSQHLVSQFEESKQGLYRSFYRSFSKELRRFFGRTHFADELATALSKLSIQVSMDIRFSPKDGKPAVKSHVRLTPDEPDAPHADGSGEEQEKKV